MFAGYYQGKTVLVTGHTGFKGSWLSTWLLQLGARVVGVAHDPPTTPSNFHALNLGSRLMDVRGDVRDRGVLERAFQDHRPDVVFHLAAQPIVRTSFRDPRSTFETNVMGTVNVVDVARFYPFVQAVVCITSDKCYENQEWPWGYRETDKLGGHEPYGASKACAELVIHVYQNRRFQSRANPEIERPVPISSTRAGNVIGGGDWADDRLIPDIVRAISRGEDVLIRSPKAVRPWQHVLESVSGYLWLAVRMAADPGRFVSSYNFGPDAGAESVPVLDVASGILARWPSVQSRLVVEEDRSGAESGLLRLDCSRALMELGWRAAWNIDQTLDAIVEWYSTFYAHPSMDMFELTVRQIGEYAQVAKENEIAWATA